MTTMKKSAVFAVPLFLIGLLSQGIAQEEGPQDEQAVPRSDELQALLDLLDLQERELALVQEQIQLTQQRIEAITGDGRDVTLIEVEAKFIEIVTGGEGELERILSLPEDRRGLPLVLDSAEYEALIAKSASLDSATVVSRPKLAVRDGAHGFSISTTQVPFHRPNGKLGYVDVGVRFSVQPEALSGHAISMIVEAERSKIVGQSSVAAQDGFEVDIPLIAGSSVRNRISLEEGQGAVLVGLQAMTSSSSGDEEELTHVLFFIRPRILPAGDVVEFR